MLSTMHLGTPRFEVVDLDARQWVSGQYVRGVPRREGHSIRVDGDERIDLRIRAQWIHAVLVGESGVVAPEGAVETGQRGLLQLTTHVHGRAVATDRRLAGVMQGPLLHQMVAGSRELLWDLPYSAITEIHILRERGPLGVRDRGISFTSVDGDAQGLSAMRAIETAHEGAAQTRKTRVLTPVATTIARLVFDARAASSSDTEFCKELQRIRDAGWVADPDQPDDLMVTIPAAPTTTSAADAGWYADPTREDRVRWWDGTAWTEHVNERPSS